MFGLQPIHIVLIALVAVVIFGPKKLPEFGKGLGKGIREFKQAGKEMKQDLDPATDQNED